MRPEQLAQKMIDDHESSQQLLKSIQTEIEETEQKIQEANRHLALYQDVRLFLQEVAEMARQEIASGLEQVVTLCLQAVFGEGISFEIEIKTARESTAIDFFVVDSTGDEDVRLSPEESMGGGLVDTVSIGLRFGMLKVIQPEPTGPIILDEPAKMVSGDRIASIASLIQELSRMFDKQCIVVTHHSSIMDVLDHSVHFEKNDGSTQIIID